MRLLLRWLANTGAILVTAYLLPRVSISSVVAALVAALVLGVLNTVVRPVFRLLALPITMLTLGLFLLVINGVILEILDWLMGESFEIEGFLWSIVAAVLIAVITTVINVLVGTDNKRSRRRERRREGGRQSARRASR